MKRSLSLAALFAVAAMLAAAWWFSSSDKSGEGLAAGPRAATAQPSRESAAKSDVALPDATAPAAAPSARTELEGVESHGAADAAASESVVRAQRSVLVVDGPTRAPLADVEVLYEELPDGGTKRSIWGLDYADLTAWLEREHPSVRSDAEGLATFDSRLDRACVAIARAPAGLGRASFERDEQGSRRIELWPAATLDVQVLGPQGAPLAAAEVALSTRNFNDYTPNVIRRTNAEGRARFEHVGLLWADRDAPWCVELVGLFGDQARVVLDRAAPPGELVVLHSPAVGAVEVRALDASGAPLKSGMARLYLLEPGTDPSTQRSFLHRPPGLTRAIANGVARFEPVRVGGELELALSGEDDSAQVQRIRAPSHAGDVVQAEFRDPRGALVLLARLVDEHGKALVGREVECQYTSDEGLHGDTSSSTLKTDDEGRLRYSLGIDRAEGEQRWLEFAVDEPDSNRRSARVELAPAYPPGEHDLGVVPLALPPCVVAGRVLDAQGAPVADAEVLAAFTEAPERGGGVAKREGRSRADGSFEVRADWDCAEVSVSASLGAALAPSAVVRRGAQGVELVLRESGWIEGLLLLDPSVASATPRLRARRTDDPTAQELRARVGEHNEERSQPGGAFRLERLEPGRYDLEVFGDHQSEPLLSLPGFDVPSGAGCADARLAGIDLRGKLTAFRLEMIPPVSTDVVLGTLQVQPLVEGADAFTVWLHNNHATLLIHGPAARVSVLVSGFRVEVLERVSSDTRVHLRRGPRVRLRAPADVKLPAPPLFVKASLSSAASGSLPYDHYQSAVFGEDRELALFAPGVGEFVITWAVEERTEHSISTSSVSVAVEQRITVRESDVEQIFEVAWPQAELDDALKR